MAAAIAGASLAMAPAHAVVSVTSTAFSYSQSFDSLAASGSNVPWANDSTLAGWSLFTGAGAAIASYNAGNGGSNAGSFYSFGTGTATDRALGGTASGGTYFGSPASGAVAGYVAAAFSNDSGSALTGFDLSFNGEQWRNGGNATPQMMTMQYGFGASYGSVSWVSAPSFGWTSLVNIASPSTALDGNVNTVAVSGNVATAWAAGDTLWLRWVEVNDVGNDHGLAIDNLSLQVTAVPEPAGMVLLLAGLPLVWGLTRHRRRRD